MKLTDKVKNKIAIGMIGLGGLGFLGSTGFGTYYAYNSDQIEAKYHIERVKGLDQIKEDFPEIVLSCEYFTEEYKLLTSSEGFKEAKEEYTRSNVNTGLLSGLGLPATFLLTLCGLISRKKIKKDKTE